MLQYMKLNSNQALALVRKITSNLSFSTQAMFVD